MTQIVNLSQIKEALRNIDPIQAIEQGVVAGSIRQCQARGEIFQALRAELTKKENLVELGNVIRNRELQRSSDEQITVADLTGVAVQDIQNFKSCL